MPTRVGQLIRTERERQEISLRALARKTWRAPSSVANLEGGSAEKYAATVQPEDALL